MHNFKELKVWKAGIEIAKATYEIVNDFPPSERFGLISQMTRASVSIPSNIAEGCGRKSNKEPYQYLSIALGSSFELETQVILTKEFNFIADEKLQQLSSQITDIQKMLYGFQESLVI